MMNVLKTSDDLAAALERSYESAIVLFKHSATCPFSARAQEQVAEAKHDLPIYTVVVQYAKDISTEIADKLGVEHQSPQAIVVFEGKPIDHYWRSEIQTDTLIDKVGEVMENA